MIIEFYLCLSDVTTLPVCWPVCQREGFPKVKATEVYQAAGYRGDIIHDIIMAVGAASRGGMANLRNNVLPKHKYNKTTNNTLIREWWAVMGFRWTNWGDTATQWIHHIQSLLF